MHPLTSSISTIALVAGLEWSGQECIQIGVWGMENGGRYLVYADEKVLTCVVKAISRSGDPQKLVS